MYDKLRIIWILLFCVTIPCFGQDSIWTKIDEGLLYTEIQTAALSEVGNSKITIVRINPKFYSLKLLTASELNESGLTAKDWVEKYNLICAINAGMFQTDHKSNVGYMKNYNHINNSRINKKYFSIAAFNPVDKTNSLFKIFDSDDYEINTILKSYNTVIQNLRLIKQPRMNRWSKQNKKWSEAALGEDSKGNILFIFSRSPFSMHEFNQNLILFPIEIECAQHLEGGPEASLYLNHKGIELKRVGSYETNFNENDMNRKYWSIPNVIGLVKNK